MKETPQSLCLELTLHQISASQSILSESFARPPRQERGSRERRAGIHREPGQSEDWQATVGPDD